MKNKIYINIIELQEELWREEHFEEVIESEKNRNYLVGLRDGMFKRRDIREKEKKYYVGLIEDKLKWKQ